MFALTQSTGSTPSANDLLKMAARGAASSAAPSFRRRGQMPSGPQALVVSNTDNSARTSEGDTIKLSKVNPAMVGNSSFGKPEISSLVKTDVKILIKQVCFGSTYLR